MRSWLGIGLAALAAGCAGGPPKTPVAPAAFAAAPEAWAAAEPGLAAPDAAWVESLGASEATRLVSEALTASPFLQAAEARAASAKARARSAAGRWLPDLDFSLSGTRTGTPTNVAGDRAFTEIMGSRITSSWEADLWGRVLDQTRAAGLDARAAADDLDGARLSTAGQTAGAWVDLIEARQLESLAKEDLATRERALEITQRRFDRGLANALALRTGRSQTAAARAQLAAATERAAQAARRLQTLLGRYPDGKLETQSTLPDLGPLAAAGSPLDLLARRPDIRSAEAQVQSAGLRVSAARKALLPRITITGAGIGQGRGLEAVTDIDGLVAQVAAGLALPIFQGGALRAEAAAAEEDRTAAAANYVETALAAWREVENALSADASLAIREAELAAAAEEGRAAQDLAEREYARGVATIFELIDAYSRRIDAERGLISARAERVANRINYHVALGGGAETGGLSPAAAEALERAE
jgi:NodT family efflux transporter outer membrane factor (OMF) lipoprotein